MPILTEIIPNYIIFLAILFYFFVAIFLKKVNFFYNYLDPLMFVFFQIFFTFFILVALNLIGIGHVIAFGLFFITLLVIDKTKLEVYSFVLIREKIWIEFSIFLFFLVLVLNLYLISTKGFLIFSDDVGLAKVEFYQGIGIFKRINQVSIPIFGLTSIFFWNGENKNIFRAIVFMLITIYLMLTLGSKSGLIDLIFIFGAYSRFKKITINYVKLLPFFILLFLSSLMIFYIILGDAFIAGFAYRFISFSDGPVYYFYGNLSKYINYPTKYVFDQMLVGLRVYRNLKFESLGPLINSLYFNYENALFGPNPQIFVEADVVFKNFYFLYYIIVAFVFSFFRKMMATPFSFLLMYMFIGPLVIDSQYAFSNLFSLMILFMLFGFYFILKYILLFNEKK